MTLVLTVSFKLVGLTFLFVCLLIGLRKKTTQPIFTHFGGKVSSGPTNQRLDLGGNPEHG